MYQLKNFVDNTYYIAYVQDTEIRFHTADYKIAFNYDIPYRITIIYTNGPTIYMRFNFDNYIWFLSFISYRLNNYSYYRSIHEQKRALCYNNHIISLSPKYEIGRNSNPFLNKKILMPVFDNKVIFVHEGNYQAKIHKNAPMICKIYTEKPITLMHFLECKEV